MIVMHGRLPIRVQWGGGGGFARPLLVVLKYLGAWDVIEDS